MDLVRASFDPAGLTAWLAQERDVATAVIIAEFENSAAAHGVPHDPLVQMLKTLLTGPTGMEQTAKFMVRLFHDDEEAFYDLIVDLAHYIATLEALDEMLEAFCDD